MTVTTSAPARIFGREPAVWLSLVAAAVALVAGFTPISTDTQAGIQAFAGAVLGLIVAVMVRPVAPAAVTAVLQTGAPLVVLAFDLPLTQEQLGLVYAFTTVLLNLLLVRPQVDPPVPLVVDGAVASVRDTETPPTG